MCGLSRLRETRKMRMAPRWWVSPTWWLRFRLIFLMGAGMFGISIDGSTTDRRQQETSNETGAYFDGTYNGRPADAVGRRRTSRVDRVRRESRNHAGRCGYGFSLRQ